MLDIIIIMAKKLLDQVTDRIRLMGYSYKTEKSYSGWVKRFILFHSKRHPSEMGKLEIEQFLTHLAVDVNLQKFRGHNT